MARISAADYREMLAGYIAETETGTVIEHETAEEMAAPLKALARARGVGA